MVSERDLFIRTPGWGLLERASLFKTGEAALGNSLYFNNAYNKTNSILSRVKNFKIQFV